MLIPVPAGPGNRLTDALGEAVVSLNAAAFIELWLPLVLGLVAALVAVRLVRRVLRVVVYGPADPHAGHEGYDRSEPSCYECNLYPPDVDDVADYEARLWSEHRAALAAYLDRPTAAAPFFLPDGTDH
jgi:hypothetical protein